MFCLSEFIVFSVRLLDTGISRFIVSYPVFAVSCSWYIYLVRSRFMRRQSDLWAQPSIMMQMPTFQLFRTNAWLLLATVTRERHRLKTCETAALRRFS